MRTRPVRTSHRAHQTADQSHELTDFGLTAVGRSVRQRATSRATVPRFALGVDRRAPPQNINGPRAASVSANADAEWSARKLSHRLCRGFAADERGLTENREEWSPARS